MKRQISITVSAAAAIFISLFGGLLVLAMFGRTARAVTNIPVPFVNPTPKPAIMGGIAMPAPTPHSEVEKVIGGPIRRQKIDDRLREQVLKQVGI